MTCHFFLSPHLDDVPLSCGGTLAKLTDQTAQIRVVSIFAGLVEVDAPLSAFAQHQHQMWGHPQQAYQTRRAEDAAALATFGLDPLWLDFLDCIYRGQPDKGIWYYNSDDDIFGVLHPQEYQTVASILRSLEPAIEAVAPSTEIIIYAPLTVGTHVDHQLTFLAALHLFLRGYQVRFYEEFPYADRDPTSVAKALTETTPTLLMRVPPLADKVSQLNQAQIWENVIQRLSPANVQRKIAAIAAYDTQLTVLFGGRANMEERVMAYASSLIPGQLGERYWTLVI